MRADEIDLAKVIMNFVRIWIQNVQVLVELMMFVWDKCFDNFDSYYWVEKLENISSFSNVGDVCVIFGNFESHKVEYFDREKQ